MFSHNFRTCLLAIYFCSLFGLQLLIAQNAENASKVEFRTSILRNAALNFNLGLRFGNAHWRPDIEVAYQLPFLAKFQNEWIRLNGQPLFLGTVGDGFSTYFGFTKMGAESRLSFQIGVKAFQTMPYDWGCNISSQCDCGQSQQRRVTFGPRIMSARIIPITQHVALEIYSGIGVRAGMKRFKTYFAGTRNYECHEYDYWEGYPDERFGKSFFVITPTVHFGFSIVVK